MYKLQSHLYNKHWKWPPCACKHAFTHFILFVKMHDKSNGEILQINVVVASFNSSREWWSSLQTEILLLPTDNNLEINLSLITSCNNAKEIWAVCAVALSCWKQQWKISSSVKCLKEGYRISSQWHSTFTVSTKDMGSIMHFQKITHHTPIFWSCNGVPCISCRLFDDKVWGCFGCSCNWINGMTLHWKWLPH